MDSSGLREGGEGIDPAYILAQGAAVGTEKEIALAAGLDATAKTFILRGVAIMQLRKVIQIFVVVVVILTAFYEAGPGAW